MAEFFRPLIVTAKTIATMIIRPSICQIEELLAWMECPNCKYCIDNADVLSQWPGLPAGVKFDPTDLELLEHLEGKVGRAASHVLIDNFIPTIEEAEGICYTHPENLPGINMDGRTGHFFHKVSNAYDVGKRKRRKISNNDHTVCEEHLRWHKTGKSKPVLDNNGVIKGWKKIMVLNMGSRKGGGKIERTNWTMHQYHLGVDQDEKQEELVVSKVFYQLQPKKAGQSLICGVIEESDSFAGENDPTAPMTYLPQPHRPNGSPSGTEQNQEGESRMSTVREAVEWLAGSSSHTVENAAMSGLDEQLSRGRTPDAAYPDPEGQPLPLDAEARQGFPDLGTSSHAAEDAPLSGLDERRSRGGTPDAADPDPEGQPLPLDAEALQGFADLGAPPDISLPPDMQLGSQDSMERWLVSVLAEDEEEVSAQREEAGFSGDVVFCISE